MTARLFLIVTSCELIRTLDPAKPIMAAAMSRPALQGLRQSIPYFFRRTSATPSPYPETAPIGMNPT
jgi:hypothetical protein